MCVIEKNFCAPFCYAAHSGVYTFEKLVKKSHFWKKNLNSGVKFVCVATHTHTHRIFRETGNLRAKRWMFERWSWKDRDKQQCNDIFSLSICNNF